MERRRGQAVAGAAGIAAILAIASGVAIASVGWIGRLSLAQSARVVAVCPECTAGAGAVKTSLHTLLGARAPRRRLSGHARRQQLAPAPGGGGAQLRVVKPAQTQELPYRVSGSVELPQPAYESVTQSNPDVAIRFTQSRVEPPAGVDAPVVPKAVWEDAQATKAMASRLKRVLRRQAGAASDMQAKVNRLRLFISDNAAAVVEQAEDLDRELTKAILKKHTRGIRGKQGAPGTPGLPGPAGAQGTNGSPGGDGARGHRGAPGTRGAAGAAGHAGAAGATGPRGLTGPRGPTGKRGELGPQVC